MNYPVTSQASLVVKEETCLSKIPEESLFYCHFSFIHLMSMDSEHMIPSLWLQPQAALCCLNSNFDNGQVSDFCCCSFCSLCYISCVPLSTVLLKMGFDSPWTSLTPSPPSAQHLSYGKKRWCSYKTKVLISHTTFTSCFYHHRSDSCCGNFPLPWEHGSV